MNNPELPTNPAPAAPVNPATLPYEPYFVNTHAVGVVNERIHIGASRERGLGGAPISYLLRLVPSGEIKLGDGVVQVADHLEINFQNGDPAKVGLNGFTVEALLAVVADRLEKFEAGPFADHRNANAGMHVRIAMGIMESRTRERQARGLEGLAKA